MGYMLGKEKHPSVSRVVKWFTWSFCSLDFALLLLLLLLLLLRLQSKVIEVTGLKSTDCSVLL